MSLCKLCGRNEPLVKAHIIPKSMYPFEGERREPLIRVPSAPDAPPERSWIGEYDPALVCAECEATFHPWDDYAVRLFREEPREKDYVYVDGEPGAYTLKTYDYARLKLFFVSLLWRASESSRPFFEHVRVGPKHTVRLRQMILDNDPGGPEEYSVFIVRLTHHDDAHKSVMSPHKPRWGHDRVTFWCFYLAGYTCAMKVDQRPTPSPQSKFILRPDEPLHIVLMKFREMQEYKDLVSFMRKLPWLN